MNYFLSLESGRLVNRINSREPTDGMAVYIGPTAVNFGMLDPAKVFAKAEQKMLKQWKEQDLASYYYQLGRWKK